MSLDAAAASTARLARYEPGVVSDLPGEARLHIEINGELAGAVRCQPDAPRELALGWAFMHRFFESGDDVGPVTVHEDRVSIMVSCGTDIARRRAEVAGWGGGDPEDGDVRTDIVRPPFAIHADDLISLARDAYDIFADDRAQDGFVHAAIASESDVHCVARDREPHMAVAKLAGWALRDGREADGTVLILRGIVDRLIVESMYRLGIRVIVTTGIPTAEAYRLAHGLEITLVGLARTARPGLLVDAGHVFEETDDTDEHI